MSVDVLTNITIRVQVCVLFYILVTFAFIFLFYCSSLRFVPAVLSPSSGKRRQTDIILMILLLSLLLLLILTCGVTVGGAPPSDVQYIDIFGIKKMNK